MIRRGGRRVFVAACVALAVLVGVAVVVTRLDSATTPYPSWSELPSPRVLVGLNGLVPCGLGKKVPSSLVPVVAWSGAAEEWCNTTGVDVVAFDGPGLPVFARGLTVGHRATVSGTLAARQVWGDFWGVGRHGWEAVVVWGSPALPASTQAMVDGLRRYVQRHVVSS